MGNETIVSLNLTETDLNILTELAVKANTTNEQYITRLIREKTAQPQATLSKGQLTAAALELVWSQVNAANDIEELKTEIAGDLLVARLALAIEQNGTVDPETVKKWAIELFT